MPALLERESAMAQLHEAIAAVGDGGGIVVAVEGPAGIGKSALVRAFLESTDAPVMIGWCDDFSVPQVLGPFEDMARERPDLSEAFDDAAPRFRRALTDLLHAGEFTVLVVEDLQWGDEATLDLLAYLGRRVHQLPAMMILTARSGLGIDHPANVLLGRLPSERLIRIQLAELSRSAVAEMATGSGRDPRELFELTGGNPFLLTEILSTDTTVPPTIVDSVSARLAGLPEHATEVAATLSVVPGVAEWELIESLFPEDPAALADLELEGLLVSSPTGMAYRHELLRRAVEGRLSSAERRRHHALVLRALLGEDAVPSRIAHHAAHAHDIDVLLDHSMAAINGAAEAGAHTQALEHVLNALPHVDRLPPRDRGALWEVASREQWFNQNVADALAAIERAIAIWEDLDDRRRLGSSLVDAARLEWLLVRPQRSRELLSRAIDILESIPPCAERAEAYIAYGQDLGLSSRMDEALDWLDRAVESAGSVGSEMTMAKARGAREVVRMAIGDVPAARADGDFAIAVFRTHNAQDELSVTYGNRIAAAINTLWLDHIDEDVRVAQGYAHEIDSTNLEIRLAMHLGRLHLVRSDWDAAEAAATHVLDGIGAGLRRSTALTVVALLQARRGRPGAVEALEEAIALVTPTGDIQRIGSVGAAAAELTWLGLIDRVEFLEDAHRLAASSRYLRWYSETAIWLRRLGVDAHHDGPAPTPHAHELSRDHLRAAEAWAATGAPFQRAMALAFSGSPDAMRTAVAVTDALGAVAARDRIHQMLREGGHVLGRRRTASTPANPAGLTTRQMEVLALLADGLTNAEIGDRLFVSPKTVDHHVSAILAKLGVPSRHDAAAMFPEMSADRPTDK